MRFRILLLLLCVAAGVSSGAEAKRLLKPEDFAILRDVDEPDLSPDGQRVVYVVGTVDLKKDKQPKNLWLAACDGSENRALTFGEISTSTRGSPFGRAEARSSVGRRFRMSSRIPAALSKGGCAFTMRLEIF